MSSSYKKSKWHHRFCQVFKKYIKWVKMSTVAVKPHASDTSYKISTHTHTSCRHIKYLFIMNLTLIRWLLWNPQLRSDYIATIACYLDYSTIAAGLYFTILHYIATESSLTVKRINALPWRDFGGLKAQQLSCVRVFTELELYSHEELFQIHKCMLSPLIY